MTTWIDTARPDSGATPRIRLVPEPANPHVRRVPVAAATPGRHVPGAATHIRLVPVSVSPEDEDEDVLPADPYPDDDGPALESSEPRPLDDVVRSYLPGLVRYATMLTGDASTAADLVQEVLLRAHVRWTRIGLMARPDLYLRRMVTNEHLSWRRRWHVRNIRPTADDVLAEHAAPQRDHAQHVVEDDAMWRQLAELPPRQRTVLVLRYYEGLSDLEIADVLGTSGATVRSHASRALSALRHANRSNPLEMS